MKHEENGQFKTTQSNSNALSLLEAIAAARTAVSGMTGLEVDSVAQCARLENGHWAVAIDVIESPARMGDNDLIATYEVQINQQSELMNYHRLRRYNREDRNS